jgi:RNA polymerase sigma factor (sigma-70 family)
MELTTQISANTGMPVEEKSSDHELLVRYSRCRDEAAFEILVRRYGPLVLGVCRRVIGRYHDAEEAFQATFLVLAQKAMAGQAPDALPKWLYGVAYRTALKRRSAIARRRAKEVQVAMFPEPAAPAKDRWADIAPVLDKELSRLPGMYQAAVICCDIKGMSREAAARSLGCPEGTLKVRLMRGRSILAKRLARQGVALSAGALAVVIAQNAASAAVPSALAASTVHGAVAILATQAVSTAAAGTKAVTLAKTSAKALLKPWLFGKVTVVTSFGGASLVALTATAALFISADPKAAVPDSELRLPSKIEQALRENGRELSPITIACKTRTENKVPMDEAIKRFNLADAPDPKRLFQERTSRTILQDHKLYVANSFSGGQTEKKEPIEGVSESVFDGNFSFSGSRTNQPSNPRVLRKEPAAMMLARMPQAFAAISPFFELTSGFALTVEARGTASGAQKLNYHVDVESAVLANLRKGGKLLSVEDVTLDGRPVTRVELEVPNPIRKGAELIDIDKIREMQKHSPGNPKWQEQVVQTILDQRKLPETCRYAYYLDPALHYAVRRFDRSFAPDTLLSRSNFVDFQQVPGRQLWLPRRVETEMHEVPNQPGKVIAETILMNNLEVTAYDFARVPDDTFVLTYTKPGTFIVDFSDPAAKTSDGALRYRLPERAQDLPAVIEKARTAPSPVFLGGPPWNGALQPAYRGRAMVWIAVANVVAISCGAAFVVWRWRKERE